MSARSTEVAGGILGDRDAGLTQSGSRDLTRSPLVKDAADVGWLALFGLFVAAFLTGGLSIFVAHWSNLPPALWVVVGDGVSTDGISAAVEVRGCGRAGVVSMLADVAALWPA